jgi:dienelactone hydrolase
MNTFKICTRFFFPAFIGLASNSIFAQPAATENKFLHRSHTYGNIALPYRLFVPENYDSTKLYPVVLALHGWGECGSDNNLQIHMHRMATTWADSANQVLHPCFVVAPQGPLNIGWYDSNVMANVYDLFDSIVNHFSIDANRQYITGLSMGGYMTWMTISSFPDRFAAAVPMSGWKDNSNVSMIRNVPIWDVHGQNDSNVPVNESRVLIEGLESLGRPAVYTNQKYRKTINLSTSDLDNQINSHADLIYSEIAGSTHGDATWTNYYNNPLLVKWVFSQYRIDTNAITLTNFKSNITIKEVDTIKWNSTYSKDSVELWFSPDNGSHWEEIASSEPNNGQYVWDIRSKEDCSFGLIKIFLKDSVGNIFGSDKSEDFAIDNAANGKPYLQIIESEIMRTSTITTDSINIFFQVGDPDNELLDMNFYFSADNGESYTKFDSVKINSNQHYFNRWLTLNALQYSTTSILKACVSDGQYVSFDSTQRFRNSNGIKPSFISNPDRNECPDFYCFPNPTDGMLILSFFETPVHEAFVEIYNLQGTLVLSKAFYSTAIATIDLKGLTDGMYMIRLFVDGINYEEKILKQ